MEGRERERERERDRIEKCYQRAGDKQASRETKERSRGKKVTTEKKSMRIAISELSSEPRAIDVRRKPILVERERERERQK